MTIYTVTSGNPSFNLTLNNGDQLQLENIGLAENTTVNRGAFVNVLSNGLLLTATVSGGLVAVEAAGTAAGTAVTGGGGQYDYGTDFQTTVTNGTEYVLSAAVAPPASPVSGTTATLPNIPGGIATSTTLDSGGVQYVQNGGKAIDTTVNNGGQEYVQFAGTAKNTVVNSGGVEQVQSGGTAIGSLISAGGNEFVSAGGTASSTTVFSGGNLSVAGGASVTGGLTVSGGTAFVAGSVATGQTVGFAGTGGDLALDNLAGFAGAVSGFAAGDQIDLFNFNPGGAAGLGFLGGLFGTPQWSFAEAPNQTSGTLTVIEGPQQAQLTLLGHYSTGDFALSNDSAGGILIKHS